MTFIDYLTENENCHVDIDIIADKIIVYDNEISLKVGGGPFEDVVWDISHIDCRQLAINETGKQRGKKVEAMFKRFSSLRDELKQYVLDYIFELRAIAFKHGICEDE